MSEIRESRVRPAKGDPEGGLILWHGRGADENDLFPLIDILDPDARLIGVTPRGPLALPPGGAHWYQIRELGYPDPATFLATYAAATSWLDRWLEEQSLDHSKVVIGGFSQGAVMSYALTLGANRPRPAGLIAFSGFIPTVEGLTLELEGARSLPVVIGHGVFDRVIGVEWGRDAKAKLEAVGADLEYREYPLPHTIDPEFLGSVASWVDRVVPG
ncbi:MAG TPA: phospholipase [Actinomycetota bacterium]|nr:phospholipase [Actinomycetota bacterium]